MSSSSRNVKFKIEGDYINTTSTSKKSTLLELKEKRRNSKGTSFSIEKTRCSKERRSHPSIYSNIKLSNNNIYQTRFDAFGNEIVKGSKNHKISFIDTISSQKIAEVILIESSYSPKQIHNDNVNCQCNNFCFIF